MTTEVLRNMLYAGSSTLDGLGYVVMDEVHYLADRFRGAVWEEVIIHLPASVTLVSLSATVSNAEEFADWLTTVRGETTVVVSEHRPVPLWQHMLVGKRLFDLFHDAKRGRQARRASGAAALHPRDGPSVGRRRASGAPGRRRAAGRRRLRADIVERLDRDGLLPAILFIFSRAGCDAAVRSACDAGLRLTTPDERTRDPRDRAGPYRRTSRPRICRCSATGSGSTGWSAGSPPTTPGCCRRSRRSSRSCSSAAWSRPCSRPRRWRSGINMPARCVVLERLVKFNGEAHVDLTPGEYTQLTGRAGRRGIDIEGHAVVVWSPEIDPRHVAGLASTRTYPLRSRFRPSYNMAVNLVGSVGVDPARDLLESSFAQFQADRSVVGLAKQVQREHRDGRRCTRSRWPATAATSRSTSTSG